MNRREVEYDRIYESGSPLVNHSLNQKVSKRMSEGFKRKEPSKKVVKAQEKRERRSRRSIEKVKNIIQGRNTPDNSLSKKDVRFLSDDFLIVDSGGSYLGPVKFLETLSVIRHLASSSYRGSLYRDVTGRESLARSLGQIIVSKQAHSEMEEPIAALKKSGLQIEIF